MTSVFKEVVAKYWLLLLKTNEFVSHASKTETANDDSLDPPASTLSRLLKNLESSGSIQYRIPLQQDDRNFDHLQAYCENFQSNH